MMFMMPIPPRRSDTEAIASPLAFHVEHAGDNARLVVDTDALAHGILRAEQPVDDRLSEHADVVGALDVDVREHAAAHDGPILQRNVFRSDAAHGRAPVLIAVDDLD